MDSAEDTGLHMSETSVKEDTFKNAKNDTSKLRKLLLIVVKNTPEVKIINTVDDCGDIRFSVTMEDLGLDINVVDKYNAEFFSPFTVNLLGELIIRENISAFAFILNAIEVSKYTSIVNRFEHKKFGMSVVKGNLVFCFHVSLIQSILMEDLKKGLMNV